MRKRLAVAWLSFLSLISTAAWATSCAPLSERYFVECASAQCATRFRTTQVDGFGVCGRRTRVEQPDAALAKLMVAVLKTAQSPAEDGIYVLTIEFPSWRGATPPTLQAFQDRLLGEPSRANAAIARTPESTLALVVEMVQRRNGRARISREAGTASDLQATARRTALLETVGNVGSWFAFWGSFCAALAALVHSIQQFFARLHSPLSQDAGRWLKPVLIQVAVAALAGMSVAFSLDTMPWPGLFLLPAVIVIWLAEGWSYFRARRAV